MAVDYLVAGDTPDSMENFKYFSLRSRMKLECLGMKFRGRATTAKVREMFSITARRKQDVLTAFEVIMAERGLIA